MPSSGSGTIHTIPSPVSPSNVPTLTLPEAWPNCAVTLTMYQQYVGYDEAAFWGVTYDGQEELSCNMLWTGRQRDQLANALAEAQSLFESVCGYPLCPTWITDFQPCPRNPITTRYSKLITMGKKSTSSIAVSESVSFLTEPAKVGPIATSAASISEVHFYLQGTDREVYPSSVTLAGGFLTAEFPRARLILPTYDTVIGWVGNRFIDLFNFAGELDIVREIASTAQTASLFNRDLNCAITTEQLCSRLENPDVGIVRVYRNCFSIMEPFCCKLPFGVELYYRAGLAKLDQRLLSAIIRLAHTLIPTSICNQCDQIHRLWEADNKIPPVLTKERINCPFGLSDGAWFAYKRATQVKMLRMVSF